MLPRPPELLILDLLLTPLRRAPFLFSLLPGDVADARQSEPKLWQTHVRPSILHQDEVHAHQARLSLQVVRIQG